MTAASNVTVRAFGAALIAVVVGTLTVLCLAPAARAHDSVVDANPGVGATVDAFPQTITLVFSGEPRPNFNRLAVSDAQTKDVLFSGEPTLEGRNVSLEVPEEIDAGPGEYIVGFQITSSDGHATRGKTTFTVAGEGAGPAGEAGHSHDAAAQETDASASARTWVWAALAFVALLVVVGAVATVIVHRRTNTHAPGRADERPDTSPKEN